MRSPRTFVAAWVPRVGLAIALGIWIALAVDMIMWVERVWSADFSTYVSGTARFLAGEQIYPAFQLRGAFGLEEAAYGTGYVYPPTAIVLGIPFVILGEPLGFVIYGVTTAGAIGIGAYLIGVHEGLSARRALLLTGLVVLSGPSILALSTGQANAWVAIGVMAMWLRPGWTGWISIVGALVKLFPIAGFAWAIRNRVTVLPALVAGLVTIAISVVVFGPDVWFDFVATMRNSRPSHLWFPQPPRQWLDPVIGTSASTAAAFALAAALLALSVRVRSSHAALFLVSLAMIIPAPDWHLHYLLIPFAGATPWLARVMARGRRSVSSGRRTAESTVPAR